MRTFFRVGAAVATAAVLAGGAIGAAASGGPVHSVAVLAVRDGAHWVT